MGLNLKKIFSYDGDDDNLIGTEDEYYSTPKNVNVQGKISDESEEVSKNNTDEELDW